MRVSDLSWPLLPRSQGALASADNSESEAADGSGVSRVAVTSAPGTGSPVTDDYHGERPWAFTGEIAQLTVDVSGEPYVDLDKEAVAIMKRD